MRLARADAFASFALSRREALWAIKALRDDPLPLFAAADAREGQLRPEFDEPAVVLDPMTLGQEVVEDYRNKGLSLRRHPVSFLRRDLAAGGTVPCATLARARDRSRITVAGLVLVRQMPGSAKGVMFITLEDETDVANLVIWPSLFERQRRLVLSAGMIGCRGRVQREGQVVHLVAEHLIDHSDLLRTVGTRDEAFPLPHGRGDEAAAGLSSATRHSGAKRGTSTVPICASRAGSKSGYGTLDDVREFATLSGEVGSDEPAVIGPMQERLALARAAEQVARFAGALNLPDVSAHSAPSPDLARILVGHPPAHVVAAVPLKPSARVDRVDPALGTPHGQRLAGIDAEEVQPRIAPATREFRADEPALWELVTTIRHVLSPEHAELKHLRRCKFGPELGIEVAAPGLRELIAVPSLHAITHKDISAHALRPSVASGGQCIFSVIVHSGARSICAEASDRRGRCRPRDPGPGVGGGSAGCQP